MISETYSIPENTPKNVMEEAIAFIHLLYKEGYISQSSLKARINDIKTEVYCAGTYFHTYDEIAYGAKIAWRNNTHCTGKMHWNSLEIRDMRHLSTTDEIFEATVEHLRLSFHKGKILPLVTIFAPGIRFWNRQLLRYAGYTQENGSVLGDPMEQSLTDAICRLGWDRTTKTPFDILPLVIQMPDYFPVLYELPSDAIFEVPIRHPDYEWFQSLDLKWYAFPAICNMRLEIGGISYTAAPFSGWYVATEIGARDFGDANRYNLLLKVAEKIGLDTRTDRSLWKDQSLVELTKAVLYSYKLAGITIVDHHTVARQFVLHEKREAAAGRVTPADWSYIISPLGSSATPVFHHRYDNAVMKPNWFYQEDAWLIPSCNNHSDISFVK